jgi:hypothetical protein
MSRQFQISEADLADLERILPDLCWDMMPLFTNRELAPRLRTQLRRVQAILSEVRWGYGPPQQVEAIDAGGPLPNTDQTS